VCSSFFSTNDHYYYNGILRTLEDKYAPFEWASHVIHCDGSGAKPTCRKVSNDLQYANGVLLTEEGRTILVNDLYEGTTIIYSVDAETKELVLERKVVSQNK
jgi:sugar lactone lactonase YvrE